MTAPKIFFLIFILSITVSAQWYQQNSGTTKRLWGVSFTDQNNGTAVGEYGTILRTTDGGTNWFSQLSDTTIWFNSVCFTDVNTGTAVGPGATILRTSDGGTTWNLQTNPAYSNLWSVSFTDANNGTAVGSGGKIVRTTNGGTTWTLQTSGTSEWLNGVSFTDPNNGTAVGDGGIILRTTNGGMNWITQSYGIWGGLWGVSFTDANTGTVVGAGGTILRTTDGGVWWTFQTSGTSYTLYGVSFTDANTGTAVGEYGTILRTTDGGTTWTLQMSGTREWLNGVSFTDANNGTVVGDGGIILRTTNGGGIPVELYSFTAYYSYNAVNLNWITATELNNCGFEIQRSTNKADWSTVGFKEGKGTAAEIQTYSFTDNIIGIDSIKLYYRLKQIDYDGSFEYSKIVEVEIASVNKFSLSQNYPNPFNPNTKIKYSVSQIAQIQIKVFDVLGNEIATLLNEEKPSGTYELNWKAEGLSGGLYFCQMKTGDFIQTRKMILLK